jgi:peptide/nickel transport system permease protein
MESLAQAERKKGISSLLGYINIRKILAAIRGIPIIPTIILTVFLFVGIFGRAISPHDPNEADFEYTLTPPFWQEGGTKKYPLGTDQLGRDSLSRLICGTSISLQVGFVVSTLSGIMGTLIALLSGYLGGKVDTILMRLTDTMISLPYFMIAIVLAAVLGPSKNNIILILAIVGWAGYARILRGEVLRIKEGDFVLLAVTSGCSKTRIMLQHIFPNVVNTLIVLVTLRLGIVIIAESSLSFLGVGVPPPNPAWGLMIAEGRSYISSAWWLCIWPGLAILLVVLSFNLMGDWLRVRLDPKFRQL